MHMHLQWLNSKSEEDEIILEKRSEKRKTIPMSILYKKWINHYTNLLIEKRSKN
jgi:hypothetical protein